MLNQEANRYIRADRAGEFVFKRRGVCCLLRGVKEMTYIITVHVQRVGERWGHWEQQAADIAD